MKKQDVCYLCGKLIQEGEWSRDHVPAAQFFPEEFRQKESPQLITLPVHTKCNTDFQKDEDYFFASLMPLADGSLVGEQLWNEARRRAESHPRGLGLNMKVYKEFSNQTPGGILLPPWRVVKNIEIERIDNVLQKIMRGLCFCEFGRVLENGFEFLAFHNYPGQTPPNCYNPVLMQEPKGKYPLYFDYKVIQGKLAEKGENIPAGHFYSWAFLFWRSLLFFVSVTDFGCRCEKCGVGLKLE